MSDRDTHDQVSAARVERVRGYRVRPEREAGVGAELDRVTRGIRRRSDAEEAAAQAWDAVVPDEFRERAVFVSFKRKQVTVRAADTGVRYRLEAWLRGGGSATYTSVAKTGVSGVKVVV